MKPLLSDITVNGEAISAELIASEAQNHPAPQSKPGLAWMAAARAFAIRAPVSSAHLPLPTKRTRWLLLYFSSLKHIER